MLRQERSCKLGWIRGVICGQLVKTRLHSLLLFVVKMPALQTVYDLDHELAKLFGGVVDDMDTFGREGADGFYESIIVVHPLRHSKVACLLLVPIVFGQQDVTVSANNRGNRPKICDGNALAECRRNHLRPR